MKYIQYSKLKAEGKLERVGQFLRGIRRDPELRRQLADFGFGEERIEECETLYEKARNGHIGAVGAKAAKGTASRGFHEEWKKSKRLYNGHRMLLRALLKQKKPLKKRLGIAGESGRAFAAWLRGARNFYDAALNNPEVHAAIAAVFKPEVLETGRAAVEKAAEYKAKFEHVKGMVIQTAKEKQEAFRAMDAWMALGTMIVRAATGNSVKLRALGIRVKSNSRP